MGSSPAVAKSPDGKRMRGCAESPLAGSSDGSVLSPPHKEPRRDLEDLGLRARVVPLFRDIVTGDGGLEEQGRGATTGVDVFSRGVDGERPAAERLAPQLSSAAAQPPRFPFTPKVVDMKRCMGRVWGGGQGGQCKKAPKEGDLCTSCAKHIAGGRGHGRVDGPVPEAKLKEFEQHAARRRGAVVGSGGGSSCADRSVLVGQDRRRARAAGPTRAASFFRS